MPAGEIDRPNPPPLPSHLPDNVLELAVQLEKKGLPDDVRKGLVDFQRAACYIAAGETWQKSPKDTWAHNTDIACCSHDISPG